MSIISAIDEWLTPSLAKKGSFPRSKHFSNNVIELYLRSRTTMLNKHLLAIATVDVIESAQNQQVFRRTFSDLKALAKAKGYEGIIVENVLNTHLYHSLSRTCQRLDSEPPSFYILFEDE